MTVDWLISVDKLMRERVAGLTPEKQYKVMRGPVLPRRDLRPTATAN
jgi:hypothetical protein